MNVNKFLPLFFWIFIICGCSPNKSETSMGGKLNHEIYKWKLKWFKIDSIEKSPIANIEYKRWEKMGHVIGNMNILQSDFNNDKIKDAFLVYGKKGTYIFSHAEDYVVIDEYSSIIKEKLQRKVNEVYHQKFEENFVDFLNVVNNEVTGFIVMVNKNEDISKAKSFNFSYNFNTQLITYLEEIKIKNKGN